MNRRVEKLEARLRPATPVAQIVVLNEADFEPADWADLMAAAAGDRERFADLAEAHTGIRPSLQVGHTVAVILDHLPPEERGATRT